MTLVENESGDRHVWNDSEPRGTHAADPKCDCGPVYDQALDLWLHPTVILLPSRTLCIFPFPEAA